MGKRILQEEGDRIFELYENGMGTVKIAKTLDRHRMGIQHYLKRYGVPLRKTSPWKNTYNTKFFSEYNPQSCYWAGFILADGCLRSDRATLTIKLANKDTRHLEKFAQAINFAGTIKRDRPNGVSQCSVININGEWLHSQLQEEFEIYPQKTYTTKLTRKVPRKYLHHFIRGIVDGDGGISRAGLSPGLHIAGTISLLKSLSWLFYDLGVRLQSNNDVPPIENRNKNDISQLNYYCTNAKLILDWLYTNSTVDTRLDRKHERYLTYFTKY